MNKSLSCHSTEEEFQMGVTPLSAWVCTSEPQQGQWVLSEPWPGQNEQLPELQSSVGEVYLRTSAGEDVCLPCEPARVPLAVSPGEICAHVS